MIYWYHSLNIQELSPLCSGKDGSFSHWFFKLSLVFYIWTASHWNKWEAIHPVEHSAQTKCLNRLKWCDPPHYLMVCGWCGGSHHLVYYGSRVEPRLASLCGNRQPPRLSISVRSPTTERFYPGYWLGLWFYDSTSYISLILRVYKIPEWTLIWGVVL